MVNGEAKRYFFSLISSRAAIVLLLLALMAQTRTGNSQSACSAQLGSLGVCGPFVLPGSTPSPNSECCEALQTVEHDCLCNTLRIASRLPTQCQLPPLSCDLS